MKVRLGCAGGLDSSLSQGRAKVPTTIQRDRLAQKCHLLTRANKSQARGLQVQLVVS